MMRHGIKTLADTLRAEAEKKNANNMGAKRRAILKSQIEIARNGAEEFIAGEAALIADRDCPGVPKESVRVSLQRGQDVTVAALRLLSEGSA